MSEFKVTLGVDVQVGDIQSQINGVKLEPIKVNIDMNHISGQISQIESQIKGLNNLKINLGTSAGVGGRNSAKGSVNDMNWAYRQMLDIQKKANSLSIKMNGLDASKNVGQIKELSSQIARLKADYQTLKTTFGSQLTPIQMGNLQAELDETLDKIKVLEARLSDTKNNLANGIKLKLATGDFSNQISKIESDAGKLSNVSSKVKVGITEVNNAFNRMQIASRDGDIDGLIKANQDYERSLKNVKNQLDINKRAEKDAVANAKLLDNRKFFQSDIDAWMTKNSAAVDKFGDRLLELKAKAEYCDQIELDGLRREFNLIDREAEAAGLKMQTFGDRIKSQFQKYGQYFSVASVMMYASQAMRDMFQQVVAIDTAMTELKKVTNESNESYDSFLSNAASRAKEIGTTIDGLITSTADFARLGYSFEQSAGLAEVANIYTVVGDEIDGVETATQSLVSTLAAFKHEMGDMSDSDFAMSIVDKFNEVSNNFAISSGGIGEALQRSASSLAAANNTLDESIALITAANTVVQNPEKVGNAFKTKNLSCLYVQKCA